MKNLTDQHSDMLSDCCQPNKVASSFVRECFSAHDASGHSDLALLNSIQHLAMNYWYFTD